ncbi:FAD-dependent oxidoreductase [Flavobacterium faecale]|uniref:FAD-dependent oxidoreductase n=1 Tax=Flavobacterium faecale TaxID=1355330 RepID=A0A2S1LDF8_9FLAO|nr:NAD(P)/FAD-dependent oxidoreductase [Flavobacterium faecale]AWG21731.1 FAD-dependent oxidoreductase [Flavobacterium faecale]
MNNRIEIAIIGAGLAGLTAAIHLARQGFSVTLFEKNNFPKHKVCGEFISNEVWDYLKTLDLDIESLHPTKINKTLLSTGSGAAIKTNLPLGGFGISRYTLDRYLYQTCLKLGVKIIPSTVVDVLYTDENFIIKTEEGTVYESKIALGSFGKRSNLDLQLKRNFITKKSPWLAVKAHYKLDFPADVVSLHNFEGGYCGVSKVENDTVNICYLVRYETFKKYKNITEFQEMVLSKNPKLKIIFENASLLFDKPLTIGQISFENKPKIENHMLMIGDAAGLIHPLCGNGMAMAIHSAKIASELITDFLHQKISRNQLERNYVNQWNTTFKSRVQFGRLLSRLLLNDWASKIVMKSLLIFPFVLPFIIKKTHGKPI